jgi:predicted nucleotidyltransferase
MSLLSEILSSNIRAEIFRLLFGVVEDELYMREIERRSHYAIGTIQTELKKLLRLDLLIKRKDGNRLYYRANKDHPLYADIHNLVTKTVGLVDVIRDALTPNKQVHIAFVFGSMARYAEKATSDIDLMVIGGLSLRKLTALLSGISEQIGREINPHVFAKDEIRKRKGRNDHFISQVLGSPKIFIIGTDNELKAMVE